MEVSEQALSNVDVKKAPLTPPLDAMEIDSKPHEYVHFDYCPCIIIANAQFRPLQLNGTSTDTIVQDHIYSDQDKVENTHNEESVVQNGVATVDSQPQDGATQSPSGESPRVMQLPTAPASSAQPEPSDQAPTSQVITSTSDTFATREGDQLKQSLDTPDLDTGSHAPADPFSTNAQSLEAPQSLGDSENVPSEQTGVAERSTPTAVLLQGSPQPKPEQQSFSLPSEPPIGTSPERITSSTAELTQSSSEFQKQEPQDEQPMSDQPLSAKIGRAREEDMMLEEPAAKRPKTDDETEPQPPEFTKPTLPPVNTVVDQMQQQPIDEKWSAPMTSLQQKELYKLHMSLKRLKDALSFTSPVDPAVLNIPTYFDVIERPMDIGTMETKLKAQEYPNVATYLADFEQIIANTRKFNGDAHLVTQSAFRLKAWFDNHFKSVPGPDQMEPVRPDKKKKASPPAPTKPLSARRESRSSLPGSARSPTASGQAFSVNPATGTPIIRRDSTLAGDRPKREIQAPPPRDLPYATAKPQRKKFQTELKFCRKVVQDLLKSKYSTINWPFIRPVDPVAENLPTYHKIVKNPMDLGTVNDKVESGQYENAKEFEADMRLIVKNCCAFNPPDTLHHKLAKELEREFDREWSAKKQWVHDHEPVSTPHSPEESSEEEEEEEEEEEVDEVDAKAAAIEQIQKQMQELSNQLAKVTSEKSNAAKAKKPKSTTKAPKKRASSSSAQVAPKAAPKKKAKTEKKPREFPAARKAQLGEAVEKLPEKYMLSALNMIRERMPAVQDQEEVELEIWAIPDDILWDLQTIVDKAYPKAAQQQQSKAASRSKQSPVGDAVATKKKHKPMTKATQDQRIAEIQNTLSGYDRQRDPADVPVQSIGEYPMPPPAAVTAAGDGSSGRTALANGFQDNTDLGAEESSGDEASEESEEE